MVETDPDLIIEPRRGKKENLLPQRALLVVNPSEAALALKSFEPLAGEVRTIHQSRLLVDRERRLCLAGPALGAAAAALVAEKLIALGVGKIWLVSCCGALAPDIEIGDVLLATAAVSGEGVSPYYNSDTVVQPAGEVTDELKDFASQNAINSKDGIIWSTDAPYRERRSELLLLQEQYGVNGVDMEFSALCSVASFRGVSLGALFVVSDLLWTRNWKPGFGGADFTGSSRDLIEKLIHYGLHMELGA